jgi:hypothetical protein
VWGSLSVPGLHAALRGREEDSGEREGGREREMERAIEGDAKVGERER